MNRATREFVIGQLCFVVFIGLCVALHPGIVLKWDEGGVSNYGIHIKTAIPYTLALVLLAFYSKQAANRYVTSDPLARRFRAVLSVYSAIVIVMLFSTYVYSLNHVLRDVHIAFGTVLITFQSFASVWMCSLSRRTRWNWVFLVTQLSGALLSLITILGLWHFLFLAEELTNTGFAGLVVLSSQKIAREVRSEPTGHQRSAVWTLARVKRALIRVGPSSDRLSS